MLNFRKVTKKYCILVIKKQLFSDLKLPLVCVNDFPFSAIWRKLAGRLTHFFRNKELVRKWQQGVGVGGCEKTFPKFLRLLFHPSFLQTYFPSRNPCFSDPLSFQLTYPLVPFQTWDNEFKKGLSKICGRQPLKNLTWYGLLNDLL